MTVESSQFHELAYFPDPIHLGMIPTPEGLGRNAGLDYRVRTSDVQFGSSERRLVLDVLRTRNLTQGDRVRQLETAIAKLSEVRECIAVNSGSSANLVALSLLVQPGTEVITSPVSFATSVMPVLQVGAVPVFPDVDPVSYCITAEGIKKCISKKTSAILVVHLLGFPCDMEPIMEITQNKGLPVIEDACEALGAQAYGRKVGSFGTVATLSFHPAHHLTTGEGGIVMTNDRNLANDARAIRDYGRFTQSRSPKRRWRFISRHMGTYDVRHCYFRLGYNFKMTELQAAIGLAQIGKSVRFLAQRRKNAHLLSSLLSDFSSLIQLPEEPQYGIHAFHAYPLVTRKGISRLNLVRYLEAKGIETRPIEGGNLTRQPFMRSATHRKIGRLPVADWIHRSGFFIGCHAALHRDDLKYAAANIGKAVRKQCAG